MKRFIIIPVALAAIAAMSVLPASATHEVTPITITVQSTYAGVCGAQPGPATLPPDWSGSLNSNASLPAAAKIPADVWKNSGGTPLGINSGPCDYGTDAIWSVTGLQGIRGSQSCNNVTRTAGVPGSTPNPNNPLCVGLHYPGAGPPVQPGRFLNFAAHSATPDPKNLCAFVSTDSPNFGTCLSLAVGYTFAVDNPATSDPNDALEGSYCGTSRGFGWTLAIGTPTIPGQPVAKTWGVVEWTPSSAGSLLPLSGVVAGTNWATNTHYKGWTGTAGKPSMRFADGTIKNVYGLTSARSYIAAVDTEQGVTGGSCSGALDQGGVSFFNQSVAIAIGDGAP